MSIRSALGEQSPDVDEVAYGVQPGAQEDTALLGDTYNKGSGGSGGNDESALKEVTLEDLDTARSIAFAWAFFAGLMCK